MKIPIINKLKKRYILYIFILLLISYCAIQIYAVFQSEVTGSVNFLNGVWQIKINNIDISNGINKEFVVDTIEIQDNEHIKPGNIAPGVSGIFNISINPENTDVSVRYDISLNEENLTNDNIVIKEVTETVTGKSLIKTAENTYTGVILLEEIKQGIYNNIKVEIEWKYDEINNEQDIIMGTDADFKLEIPINIHVCQYFGEEI